MADGETVKKCLVICPSGDEGSDKRKRTEMLLEHCIKPVARKRGYKVDNFLESRPGEITKELLRSLREADLVIADLAGHNANVFYELGYRHATGRPFIHIAQEAQDIPFDIATFSVIQIDNNFRVDKVNKASEDLESVIKKIESGESKSSFEDLGVESICEQLGYRKGAQTKTKASTKRMAVYSWVLTYQTDIASKWVGCQKQSIRDCINKYESEGGTPKDNQVLRNALAEYLQYKAYQSTRLTGDLYYILDTKSKWLNGWGNLEFIASSPIAIHVDGNICRKNNENMLVINYSQPSRQSEIDQGLPVTIRAYSYSIHYKCLDNEENCWVGALYLPGCGEVVLAETELNSKIADD